MSNSKYKKFIKIVAQHHPKLKQKDFRIFDDGWDHVVIVVSGKQAYRFPRRGYQARKMLVEARFLNQFQKRSPVRIPNYKLQYDGSLPYVIYDFIPGKIFSWRTSKTFSKKQHLRVAAQLGRFLNAMHSFSAKEARKIGIKRTHNPGVLLRGRLRTIRRRVFPLLTKVEQRWVGALYADYFASLRRHAFRWVLCHNDMAEEHILVDSEKKVLSGIIDFGDIGIGDPAFDFQFKSKYGNDFLQTVCKNYKLPRDSEFDNRRKFYEKAWRIQHISRFFGKGDRKQALIWAKRLKNYIHTNPIPVL